MSQRSGMSEVKIKVRHNALILNKFTVADLVRATSLNPESVRTELQRMKKQGFVRSEPQPNARKSRGGRAALYFVTEDPRLRLLLSKSIEAFLAPQGDSGKPTSRHYVLAQQLIRQVPFAEKDEQARLLNEAERALEIAERAEGGRMVPKSIKAYLEFERARIAFLRGQREVALPWFESLMDSFKNLDERMTQRIDEFIFCLREASYPIGEGESSSQNQKAACAWVDELRGRAPESPIIWTLTRIIRQLAQSPDERAVLDSMKTLAQQMARIEEKLDKRFPIPLPHEWTVLDERFSSERTKRQITSRHELKETSFIVSDDSGRSPFQNR